MLNFDLIRKQFARIGARVRFDSATQPGVALDVVRDARGELFSFAHQGDPEVVVMDVQARDRHLLLLVRDPENAKLHDKLLCGHDERFFFVASVDSGSNVRQAKESLKPDLARESQAHKRVKNKNRNKRKNRGFVRQGEWFFVPVDLNPPAALVLRDEPLSRNARSKPHMVEMLYRRGGTLVYVSVMHPTGLTQTEYQAFLRDNPNHRLTFRTMQRESEAFAMGRVSHRDHKTLVLRSWHRVVMNAEPESEAVAFLD